MSQSTTQSQREELEQDLENWGCDSPHHRLLRSDAGSRKLADCIEQVWYASPAQIAEYHRAFTLACLAD